MRGRSGWSSYAKATKDREKIIHEGGAKELPEKSGFCDIYEKLTKTDFSNRITLSYKRRAKRCQNI